jgi:hypothetical protein
MFPDDYSCAAYLAKARWPRGFVCPDCGSAKGWKQIEALGLGMRRRRGHRRRTRDPLPEADVGDCRDDHAQDAPAAPYMVPGRSSRRHALQRHQRPPAAGQARDRLVQDSWLLLHKLRRAMVDPDRSRLGGPDMVVQVDETEMPFRRKTDPLGDGRGRSKVGKIIIAGAVECRPNGTMGRIRLEQIQGYGRAELHPFVIRNTDEGTIIKTDGNKAYRHVPGRLHDENVIPSYMQAHFILREIHRVFSNLKRWAMGVYHGLRPHHVDVYLNEFVFRWNRRRHYRSSFDRLLGLGMTMQPRPYEEIIANRVPYMARKWLRQRRRSREDKSRLYRALVHWGMGGKEARGLIEETEPRPYVRYLKRPPYRPVLARRQSAFVYDPHMNASRSRRRIPAVLSNWPTSLMPLDIRETRKVDPLGRLSTYRPLQDGV